jgi:DNA invertase Pin-like site-specific DNA recombinase
MNSPHSVVHNGKAISYVRFSTPEQATGDSERRQIDAARAYCRTHGLTLDETIQDRGLSGYTGAHLKRGNLTGLLQNIQRGVIAKGTTLIIESLDRLSRQDAIEQLSLFTQLLKSGFNIVSLENGVELTRETAANPANLFMSIASMLRGHDESKMKSMRVGEKWQEKRKNAAITPLTARAPLWLKLNKNKVFETISARVKVVKLIFKLAASGKGKRIIAKELNERHVKPFGAGKWQDSYIYKILNNPAVLGVYQPHTRRNGQRRRPEGSAIEGYYPQIISQDVWDNVHKSPKLPTGPRTVRITNLFTGLLVDAKSKSTFGVENKTENPLKPLIYLRPRANTLGLPCEKYSLNYIWFEEVFLRFCAEVDWVQISADSTEDAVEIETEESKLSEHLQGLQSQITNLTEAVAMGGRKSIPSLVTKLEQVEMEFAAGQEKLEKIRASAAVQTQSIEALKTPPAMTQRDDPQYRATLQMEIRKRITKIRVYPHTDWSPADKRIYQRTPGWTTFVVHFINGALRILTAQNNNPASVIVHEVRGVWHPEKAFLR